MSLKGLAELEQQLLSLKELGGVKVLSAAGRKAFKPVIESAKARVRVDSAALKDAIKMTTKKAPKGNPKAVVAIGLKIQGPSRKSRKLAKVHARMVKRRLISGPKTLGVNPRVRWHLEEFGTAKAGAHPYIRPAFDSNVQGMVETLKNALGKGVARAIKKQSAEVDE